MSSKRRVYVTKEVSFLSRLKSKNFSSLHKIGFELKLYRVENISRSIWRREKRHWHKKKERQEIPQCPFLVRCLLPWALVMFHAQKSAVVVATPDEAAVSILYFSQQFLLLSLHLNAFLHSQ